MTGGGKAARQLQQNRDRINATARGTPAGSWKSKRKRSTTIRASYRTNCATCDVPIYPGMRIKKRAKGWTHEDCTVVWDKRSPASSSKRRTEPASTAAGAIDTRGWGEEEFAAYLDEHGGLPPLVST